MRRRRILTVVAVGGLLALGVAACGGSGSPKAAPSGPARASTTAAQKKAFCGADLALDQASDNVTSNAGFLAVVKAHLGLLDTLLANRPSGAVGNGVKVVVAAARKAASTGNVNLLNNGSVSADGTAMDTYCGVDGEGQPLPAFFAAGKNSAFCAVDDQISAGTNRAGAPPAILAFLTAHQSLINEFAADLGGLPTTLQAQARTLVTTARAAIIAKSPTALGTAAVSQDSQDMQLYCGQNT